MNKFIFFIIYAMKTLDGNKNSASKLLEMLIERDVNIIKKKTKLLLISA